MAEQRRKAGEIRRSQALHTFGVGSVIDLPNLSTLVLGLHRWDPVDSRDFVTEERLLGIVRHHLGPQVNELRLPPIPKGESGDVFDPDNTRGLPVEPFPRWLRCPICELLAPIDSGHFVLKHNAFRPEMTRYVHINCRTKRPPQVTPARFVLTCTEGHLSDFPWRSYLGCSATNCGPYRFREAGVSAEVAQLWVECDGCQKKKPMIHAFGENAQLPECPGRHPHLGSDYEVKCKARPRAMLVGASNLWFPITVAALSLPSESGRLENLINKHWTVLEKAKTREILEAFREVGQLSAFDSYTVDELWEAMEEKRQATAVTGADKPKDLKIDEWALFSDPGSAPRTDGFVVTETTVPERLVGWLDRVVLVEQLRVVKALTGFTRIISPGDFADIGEIPDSARVQMTRAAPTWVPAAEVRGEGIFLQFSETRIQEFVDMPALKPIERRMYEAHKAFRRARKIEHPGAAWPGLRYMVLHVISHLLIRQFSIDCGYAAASVAERIYSREPEADDGPMAGILLYTAAADSEGTLGGLVALGRPDNLERHLVSALQRALLCSSDPLCSEHHAEPDGLTLHEAACHACLFVSETSCERGNKYLDRNLVVPTIAGETPTLFAEDDLEG